jgi:sialate O-acetylesterase
MKANGFRTFWPWLAAMCFAYQSCHSEVQLPSLFGDNMVLQQGVKARVWGKADPGEKVTVGLDRKKATATADEKGNWAVKLGPLKSGGPFVLTITGKNTIALKNVLVGEVWVCSGQSNMQWAVNQSADAEREIAEANYPKIRLFSVPRTVADIPQDSVVGAWAECSPQTVPGFSAVGYFFGREIHKALKGVPVGLIHSSWGGTPAEAWTSLPTLEAEPDFKPLLDWWNEELAKSDAQMKDYEKKMSDWKQAAEAARARGEQPPNQPQSPTDQRKSSNRPANLYNAMIAPLAPFAIRGAIWYQGESNATQAYQYRNLFPTMIRDWRRAWGEGDFPFLFVQLANFRNNWTDPRSWAELREAQLMTLSLRNTGMAVAIDIGDSLDIHPKNKQEVGRRLALAARAMVHGERVSYSGPIYKSMSIKGDAIRLRFAHVGRGLFAKREPLKSFVIAGKDRRFVWADTEIKGKTVVVRSKYVPHPVAVRYAWWDDPVGCNLYNADGLPASPFRTDDWPGVTAEVARQKTPRPNFRSARSRKIPPCRVRF